MFLSMGIGASMANEGDAQPRTHTRTGPVSSATGQRLEHANDGGGGRVLFYFFLVTNVPRWQRCAESLGWRLDPCIRCGTGLLHAARVARFLSRSGKKAPSRLPASRCNGSPFEFLSYQRPGKSAAASCGAGASVDWCRFAPAAPAQPLELVSRTLDKPATNPENCGKSIAGATNSTAATPLARARTGHSVSARSLGSIESSQ